MDACWSCGCLFDDGGEVWCQQCVTGVIRDATVEVEKERDTLRHRLRRVQAAARMVSHKRDAAVMSSRIFFGWWKSCAERHLRILVALKRWHDDMEEGTVCRWCGTDLHEDESEIPHTEDCPWAWILDACREAGVE